MENRETLKISLAGKGNQHLPTCFPHPVYGGRASHPVSTLTKGPWFECVRHAGGILGDSEVSIES